ncbi:MAG: arsenate reductase ArsC [Candidatus Krumholzibacteria bacterium]|nr:arsenate reductase ArsC [Candidatus Krumholzibacteria bacterium]
MTDQKTKVLFICIGNMCRSPMAEGFARAMGDDVVETYSAGIHPTGVVSEDAIFMMEENGIDISRQRSNGLVEVPLDEIDIAACMTGIPGSAYLPEDFGGKIIDWDIDDPIGRSLSTFRRVRDEIEVKVKDLLEEIRKANFSSSA